MLFKRRNPRAWYQHLKEWFWPSAGWGRMFQYLTHRVVRIPGSSYSVASGLAFGAAVSFTPFIGLHFLISMGLAWLFRANVVAAAIGTVVGNPWTFPFIWVVVYQTGILMLGAESATDITEVLRNFKLFDNPYTTLKPVLLPLILGSIPYVIISWVAVYFPTKTFIEVRRARRARRKQKNEQKT